jgi:hypothetical protein
MIIVLNNNRQAVEWATCLPTLPVKVVRKSCSKDPPDHEARPSNPQNPVKTEKLFADCRSKSDRYPHRVPD